MKKILMILCLGAFVVQAQDITNKLGGTSAGDTYDVTDSADNVLLRVQGDGKVGFGTETPDATLDVHGTVKAFGAWDTMIFGSTYQAGTDGFVVARCMESTSGYGVAQLSGYTDSSTPPTTIRAQDFDAATDDAIGASITMPVRKGDYWKVNRSGGSTGYSIYWIPLGQ